MELSWSMMVVLEYLYNSKVLFKLYSVVTIFEPESTVDALRRIDFNNIAKEFFKFKFIYSFECRQMAVCCVALKTNKLFRDNCL